MKAVRFDSFLNELIDDLRAHRLVLPTLPEVALQIRDVADDDTASMADILRAVGTDAALSARIIQVANSPMMRGGRIIENLPMAVSRLGVKLIRDMIISMAMEQMFQATSDATDRRLRAVFAHSKEVAAISHALASQFTSLEAEQAMLAGLVHEIGALPILTKAEEFPELLEDEIVLDTLLQQHHAHIGAEILTAWNFPADVIKVAREHENVYQESVGTTYVDVVIVANLQTRLGADHLLAKLDWSEIPAFAKLGLNPEVNVVEMAETAEQIREMRNLLA